LDAIRNAAVQVVAAYADTVSNQLEAQILRGALKGRFWRGCTVVAAQRAYI
jgi:hypothetical protein